MNIKLWNLSLLEAASHEFGALIANAPVKQRGLQGELRKWSPKDRMAHLVYWLELYGASLWARRCGRQPEDTRNYQVRNDAEWPVRRDWSSSEVERAWQRALLLVAAEVEHLNEQ